MIQWLTRDWGLKLVSFILAIGLWYYAVSEESIEVKRVVPLEIKIKNSQMSLLNTSSQTLMVTLQTPRALVSDMTSKEIKAVHEIGSDVQTIGDYSFRVEPDAIKLPMQVRVVKIEPEVVRVTLDQLIVQKFAIKPNFVGDPAFGYELALPEVELNPNAILLEGPKGQLGKLDSVKTEPVELVGRLRSFRRTVSLDLPPNVKPLSEALVDAYIPIKEQVDEKTLKEIPVRILKSAGTQEEVQMDDPLVTVTLKGSKPQLEKLTPASILIYLDTTGLEPGTQEVPLKLTLPEGVTLKEEAPLVRRITLKKK